MIRQESAILGAARRSRASGPAMSPIGRGAAPELPEHHPARDRRAERRRDEADEGREPERQDRVDQHRVYREAEGRAGVLAGVVERREHLLQHEGGQARRRRPRPPARSARCRRRSKAPRWNSTATIGTGITTSATAAGSVSARVNSVARLMRVAPARAVAGGQPAREVGQQHDADGDADDAERQLVEPVGVGEPGDGAVEEASRPAGRPAG